MSKDICKGYKDGDYFCSVCIRDCKYMTGCCDCYEVGNYKFNIWSEKRKE